MKDLLKIRTRRKVMPDFAVYNVCKRIRIGRTLQTVDRKGRRSKKNLRHLTICFHQFLLLVVTYQYQEPMNELPNDIADIVDVLRHLHWIHTRLSSRSLLMEGASNDMQDLLESTNMDFLSHKISAKMLRQLSDPVALCGGVIPDWCFAVARDASFLMSFETRRILFQSTSLGVPRALHSLQRRTNMNGGGNTSHLSSRPHREEARVGRLQRQKVRVHRHRYLSLPSRL